MGGKSSGAGGGGGSGAATAAQSDISPERLQEIESINKVIHQVNDQQEGNELDLSFLTGESTQKLDFEGLSYEHDVAPRLTAGVDSLRSGNYERGFNLLVQFTRKEQTYENISKTVGKDVRKAVNEVFDSLTQKVELSVARKAVSQFVNKAESSLSAQEKNILRRVGFKWDGKQWKQ